MQKKTYNCTQFSKDIHSTIKYCKRKIIWQKLFALLLQSPAFKLETRAFLRFTEIAGTKQALEHQFKPQYCVLSIIDPDCSGHVWNFVHKLLVRKYIQCSNQKKGIMSLRLWNQGSYFLFNKNTRLRYWDVLMATFSSETFLLGHHLLSLSTDAPCPKKNQSGSRSLSLRFGFQERERLVYQE